MGRASLGKGEVEEEEKVGDDNKAGMLQKEKKMRKRTRLRELGPVDSPIRGPNVVEIFVRLTAIKGLKILEVGNDNGVLFGFSGNHEPRIYRSLKLKSTVD